MMQSACSPRAATRRSPTGLALCWVAGLGWALSAGAAQGQGQASDPVVAPAVAWAAMGAASAAALQSALGSSPSVSTGAAAGPTSPGASPSLEVPGMAAAMRFWGTIRPSLPGQDPFERLNRAVFIFNGVVDHFVVKPVAEAYEAVVPKPVRAGVGNVLGNVSDAWSAVNLVLQGKGSRAAEVTMRVGVNTVFGLGGLLDIATEAGLERQSEDFGQTLGRWGVPPGPYLVLPLFGPSSVRDAVGFRLDTAYNSAAYPSDAPQKWRWTGLRLTDARTDALPFTRLLDTVALDKYTFVRDAYLTRRRSLVYDGNPPPDEQDELPVEAPVQE